MNLACRRTKRLLSRFVDGELTDEGAVSLLRRHLEVCSRCKRELDCLLKVKDLMSQKERLAAGENFWKELNKRLKPQAQIFRLKWVIDMGVLSKRLIPAPVIIMVLIMALLFGRVDSSDKDGDEVYAGWISEDLGLVYAYLEPSFILETIIPKE
jgi:anti-sigma factor RsiW